MQGRETVDISLYNGHVYGIPDWLAFQIVESQKDFAVHDEQDNVFEITLETAWNYFLGFPISLPSSINLFKQLIKNKKEEIRQAKENPSPQIRYAGYMTKDKVIETLERHLAMSVRFKRKNIEKLKKVRKIARKQVKKVEKFLQVKTGSKTDKKWKGRLKAGWVLIPEKDIPMKWRWFKPVGNNLVMVKKERIDGGTD